MYDSSKVEKEHIHRLHQRETAFSCSKARYYNPGIGRFVSEDPLKKVTGIDIFAYTNSNPIYARDPSGLFTYTLDVNVNEKAPLLLTLERCKRRSGWWGLSMTSSEWGCSDNARADIDINCYCENQSTYRLAIRVRASIDILLLDKDNPLWKNPSSLWKKAPDSYDALYLHEAQHVEHYADAISGLLGPEATALEALPYFSERSCHATGEDFRRRAADRIRQWMTTEED